MKRLLAALILCVLVFSPLARAQDDSPEDQYTKVYGLIQRAEQLQSKGRTTDAGTKFLEAQQGLKKLRDTYPEWNPKMVKYRGEYVATRLAGLGVKTNAPSAMMIEGPKDPIDLKLKWQVGKRYLQRTEMSQSADISAAGQSQKQDMKLATDIAVSALKEHEGGGADMELEYVALAMSMKTGGMNLSFDSHQPADQDATTPAAAIFRKVVGAKIHFVTDADGKVQSVEGVQEMIDRIAGTNSPEAQSTLKGLLGGDNVKQFSPTGLGLPDKAVKVGDSWPVKSEMDLGALGGKLIQNLNYTLKGWELHGNRKCAVLDFSGDMSSKPAEGDDAPAAKMTVEAGKVSGKSWFDYEQGLPVETEGNSEFTMKMSIQGNEVLTKVRNTMGNKLVSVTDISQ